MTFSRLEETAIARGYTVRGVEVFGPRGNVLKVRPDTEGYPVFRMKILGVRKNSTVRVHRLAAFQKFGVAIYQEGIKVRHQDDNKLNFHPDNLILGTHSQNMMDKPAEVRRRAAMIATAKVRKYNPEEVRAFYEINGSFGATMRKFKITSTGSLSYALNKACGISQAGREMV